MDSSSLSPEFKEKFMELRENITKGDLEIVRLLGSRFRLTQKVGELKLKNGLQIRDKEREKVLLEHLTKAGDEEGLPDQFIASLYELIIKLSVMGQEKLINATSSK